jgi:transcriptional regulator with XRE-family HTH domain
MKKRYFSGRKVFIARINKGLSIVRLAEMAGLAEDHLTDIELERVKPSVRTIVMLAKALEVDFDVFFE